MKKRIAKFKEKEPVIWIAVLFLFGILFGVLFIRLVALANGSAKIDEEYLKKIAAAKPDLDLFLYTAWKQLKGMILFFLLALTWLGVPYIAWILLHQGFLLGFLALGLFYQYQFGGLFLAASYYFPQCIIRVPLWLYCFSLAWQAWQKGKGEEGKRQGLYRMHVLQLNGKKIVMLMACCFLQSAVETFAGTWLLQKAVGFFCKAG